MPRNQIRGNEQIKDNSLDKGRLEVDFLAGADLNLTDGNNDATITGLSAGSATNDAVNKGQLDAAIAAIVGNVLASVKTIATGDETLSGTGQTINGYNVVAGDRIAVFSQTTSTEDGIYVAAAGAWALADDSQVGDDLGGKAFAVEAGTEADTFWLISNDTGSGVVGTDDIVAVKASESTPVDPTSVYGEEPTVTGGTATVSIANTPIAGTLRVYLNGLRVREGSGNDYTVSGTTITFEYNLKASPGNPDVVQLDYKHN